MAFTKNLHVLMLKRYNSSIIDRLKHSRFWSPRTLDFLYVHSLRGIFNKHLFEKFMESIRENTPYILGVWRYKEPKHLLK